MVELRLHEDEDESERLGRVVLVMGLLGAVGGCVLFLMTTVHGSCEEVLCILMYACWVNSWAIVEGHLACGLRKLDGWAGWER